MITIRNLDESDSQSEPDPVVWRKRIEVYQSSYEYYFYNVYTGGGDGDIFV